MVVLVCSRLFSARGTAEGPQKDRSEGRKGPQKSRKVVDLQASQNIAPREDLGIPEAAQMSFCRYQHDGIAAAMAVTSRQ